MAPSGDHLEIGFVDSEAYESWAAGRRTWAGTAVECPPTRFLAGVGGCVESAEIPGRVRQADLESR